MMQIIRGWYLPDNDTHMRASIEKFGYYQVPPRKTALRYVKKRGSRLMLVLMLVYGPRIFAVNLK